MAALSKLLQQTMLDQEAFLVAVAKGYIVVGSDEEHLHWTLGGQTMLAYFCGRMWCGDCGRYSRRRHSMLWMQGQGTFPGAMLDRLFGTSVLKQTRQRRKKLPLPEYHQLIDLLFDTKRR